MPSKEQLKISEAMDRMRWADGIGYLPIECSYNYDAHFFNRCKHQESIVINKQIVQWRIKQVQKAISYRKLKTYVVDVGIGSGHFLKELHRTTPLIAHGVDINEEAIKWLHQQHWWVVNNQRYQVMTFWNSFQYIPVPQRYIEDYKPCFVVMSLPIFRSKEDACHSVLLDINKVYWYCSRAGLIEWMRRLGYGLLSEYDNERTQFHQRLMSTFVFTTNSYLK